ncbi:hypothetical protein [Blastococcus sp. CT_GayMR20]|uniref:arsenate reductase/protein-tyrosine-phosphatase family protein n=1 Tax=Blastococcus sp. CT_GayMR20 TaxID=2559609 RepID=UPI0014312414|nr:hypothetical protein [Blastococcus sp. CT_GayMR20]
MRVLFVCTGNMCRSPLAERILRARVTDTLGPELAATVSVASAGLETRPDLPMDRHTAKILTRAGLDSEGFRTRTFDRTLAEESDLVLAMTCRHRTTALALAPRTMRRTFTLIEASDLVRQADLTGLDQVPLAHRGAELATRLQDCRARRPVNKLDDVPDPIGRSMRIHKDVARRVTAALQPIADALLTGGAGEEPEPNVVADVGGAPAVPSPLADRPPPERRVDPHASVRHPNRQRGNTKSSGRR